MIFVNDNVDVSKTLVCNACELECPKVYKRLWNLIVRQVKYFNRCHILGVKINEKSEFLRNCFFYEFIDWQIFLNDSIYIAIYQSVYFD